MAKDYDCPMHTAEHVLNSVIMHHFGSQRCFSTHINPKKSKVDFHFSRALTDDEARQIEADVNAVLARNLPVNEHFMPRTEAATLFNLDRLPESAGDTLRIICVGDPTLLTAPRENPGSAGLVDACPCIGQHVSHTNECGQFTLVSHEFNDGVLRVRFKVTFPASSS